MLPRRIPSLRTVTFVGLARGEYTFYMEMQLTPRDIETFKALNRVRYGRANFLHRLVGGSKQNVHRRFGTLYRAGYLSRPEQQRQSWNARYAPRVYELTPKSRKILQDIGVDVHTWSATRQFWHQLMIADILLSFEAVAKMSDVPFRMNRDILGEKPLKLPCFIEWGTQKASKPIEPDAIFAVGDTYFLLEADRNTENLLTHNLELNSYLRKLLCYRDVAYNKTAEKVWGIPQPFVLNVTTSRSHLENIKKLFVTIGEHFGKANPKSYYLLYRAIPLLGSLDQHPEPLVSILDDVWDRVGHPNVQLRKEVVAIGHAQTAGAA